MKKRNLVICLLVILTITLLSGCKKENGIKSEKNEDVFKIITTEDLKQKLGDDNFMILDIRSTYEYNGWQLNGEKRGGHIKGAINFPLYWVKDENGKLIDKNETKKLLDKKGFSYNKNIVVYGMEKSKIEDMINYLYSLGYRNLYFYDKFIDWSNNENLPINKLENYEKLVYPGWVFDLINGNKPKTYNNDKFLIFEVSWGEPKEYNKGHIPSAIYLDTNEIEEEPLWNRKSDKDLENMLLKYGITYDTTVILYGRDNTAAARFASILMYLGVSDVRLLDGGFNAWLASGYEVEKEKNEPVPVSSFGVKVPQNPHYIIDTEEVKRMLNDENSRVVSIRSWKEYIGETSGYSYIKPKGRIKGALWGHAGSDPYHMEDFRNIDNTMRNFNEIKKFWEEWGITPDKKISFHCGTGWRASEAFFYAYLMGFENISVYDGGWFEWSMDKNNPIELGEPNR